MRPTEEIREAAKDNAIYLEKLIDRLYKMSLPILDQGQSDSEILRDLAVILEHGGEHCDDYYWLPDRIREIEHALRESGSEVPWGGDP